MDSVEISLFDELDACCMYGYDAPMKQHPWINKNQMKLPNTFPTFICDDFCYGDEFNNIPLSMPPIDIHGNEKHALCGSYFIEFVNNAPANYY